MPKQENFEDLMTRLNKIVEELEKGDIDLDTSVKLYEEGLKLSKTLKDELNKFEEKINSLNDDK